MLSKHAIKPLNNALISMNFSEPTVNIGFVVFHFFSHTPHELVTRVNLQHLQPSPRAALVN